MKIVLELAGQRATIEDDSLHPVAEFAVNLIRQALLGVGYHPDSIDEAFLTVASEHTASGKQLESTKGTFFND